MQLLLVDDHSVVRQGYSALIQMLLPAATVMEAADGATALSLAQQQPPTLAVLDINLVGMSGITLANKLLELDPELKILFFSMYDEASLIQQAMQTGALGYISKRSEPAMMEAAIATVLQGKQYLSPEIAQKLATIALHPEQSVSQILSGRELDIFLGIAQGKDKSDIAQVLGINEKTVANSTVQIKQKLGVKNLTEIVHIALSQGYLQR